MSDRKFLEIDFTWSGEARDFLDASAQAEAALHALVGLDESTLRSVMQSQSISRGGYPNWTITYDVILKAG